MKYLKANAVLPEELIMEIQKYVQGETIYIPKSDPTRKWGAKSGSRRFFENRNSSIRTAFKQGRTIAYLADEYFLSTETIKKIVYAKH
ncbi:CD3324 family protein [Neobacillus sp. D3-1R]|uniref:CD3324 family protein n=1 Tax=Neobacillus sp. D3-1R TaxID=3445778 RepID=UPI003FA08D87